jgi:hypothetical protein
MQQFKIWGMWRRSSHERKDGIGILLVKHLGVLFVSQSCGFHDRRAKRIKLCQADCTLYDAVEERGVCGEGAHDRRTSHLVCAQINNGQLTLSASLQTSAEWLIIEDTPRLGLRINRTVKLQVRRINTQTEIDRISTRRNYRLAYNTSGRRWCYCAMLTQKGGNLASAPQGDTPTRPHQYGEPGR